MIVSNFRPDKVDLSKSLKSAPWFEDLRSPWLDVARSISVGSSRRLFSGGDLDKASRPSTRGQSGALTIRGERRLREIVGLWEERDDADSDNIE